MVVAVQRGTAHIVGRGIAVAGLLLVLAAGLSISSIPAATLVLISPHNEAIREEFGRAFSEWHQARFADEIGMDWRVIGGTSESLRFVQSEFARKPVGIGI